MASLSIIRGRDFAVGLELTQPNGSPLDITGCRLVVTFKKKLDDDVTDSSAFFRAEIVEHDSAQEGRSTLSCSWDKTKAFPLGEFYYDVEMIDATGSRLQLSDVAERGEVLRPVTNR
jgi:hypothetical protein